MQAVANDGTIIMSMGSVTTCSNGESFTFSGHMLVGAHKTVSMNVENISEAIGIVEGMHGGRKM